MKLMKKLVNKVHFFFCYNRVEKISVGDDNQNENYQHIKPIRFFEYPFFNNEVLFFEICKFTSLVANNPIYSRLEKIKK